MATDDFTPIADDHHANLPQPHLDVHARPSRSQSFGSPKRTLAIATADEGSANGDFYAHSLAAGEESDPNKSETPSAQVIRRSPYGYKRGRPNGAESESASEYRKDREEWNDAAIECLLEAYTEKFNQLNRGNLRGRDWKEVEGTVNERCGAGAGGERQNTRKSVEQCKNKIDNLKKRYKVELQKMSSGGLTVCSWHWFKKIEAIVGNSPASKGGDLEDRNSGGSGSTTANRKGQRFLPTSAAVTNNLKAKSQPTLKWQRVVFKISGAALSGSCQNIDPKVAMQIAREVATACRVGVEVAIIVGGRNFFCGDTWVSATGLDRPTAYQIGMMATVMNSLLLQSALEKLGIQTRVQSTFSIPEVAEPYNRQRAIRHLEKGRVVIFGGIGAGSGNPLFSTDTAAALRASEINAEAVLKGTNVDGVYDCHSGNNNVTLNHMSFREVASRGVTSMDMMAITYCEENGIPVVVFNLLEPGHISRALCGDQVGTLIDQTGRVN